MRNIITLGIKQKKKIENEKPKKDKILPSAPNLEYLKKQKEKEEKKRKSSRKTYEKSESNIKRDL